MADFAADLDEFTAYVAEEGKYCEYQIYAAPPSLIQRPCSIRRTMDDAPPQREGRAKLADLRCYPPWQSVPPEQPGGRLSSRLGGCGGIDSEYTYVKLLTTGPITTRIRTRMQQAIMIFFLFALRM